MKLLRISKNNDKQLDDINNNQEWFMFVFLDPELLHIIVSNGIFNYKY